MEGKQEVGYYHTFYCEYPYGTWWMAKVDSRYVLLLDDYISQIKKKGNKGFGLYL